MYAICDCAVVAVAVGRSSCAAVTRWQLDRDSSLRLHLVSYDFCRNHNYEPIVKSRVWSLSNHGTTASGQPCHSYSPTSHPYPPFLQVMAYSPLPDVPLSGETHVTDYTRWRLSVTDDGGHLWHYLRSDADCKSQPQSTLEKYWLGLSVVRVTFS